ncbi:MAG: phosphatidate cytidylyltransferase, partial [Pseudomonadota bacterium]
MSAAGANWDDLIQRFVSGGIAAAVGLWAMWMGGHAFHALVAVVAGIMIWELARMVGGADKALALGALSGVSFFVLTSFPIGYVLPLIFLPTLVGVAQLEIHKSTFALYASAVMMAALGLVFLRDDFGFGWMAWLALVVIAADILGYFAGRFIGGPKFWPKVSPKKTWSGTIAGWLGAALVAIFYIWQGASGPELIGISIAIAIAGQLGDVA